MVDPSPFPFTFNNEACSTCRGTCCRWGGYVWVTEEELIELAQGRGMEVGVFADTYLRAAYGRLSLQDRLVAGEGICCMFDIYDNKCTIYENRPSQCRTFPFWKAYQEDFSELLEYCPGIQVKE